MNILLEIGLICAFLFLCGLGLTWVCSLFDRRNWESEEDDL